MRFERRLVKARTMLFTVKLSDTVASVVVLTECLLILAFIKGGVVVPGSGSGGLGVGSTVIKFALPNVDCTRNDGRVCQKLRGAQAASLSMYLRRQHRKRRRRP